MNNVSLDAMLGIGHLGYNFHKLIKFLIKAIRLLLIIRMEWKGPIVIEDSKTSKRYRQLQKQTHKMIDTYLP